MGYHCTSTQLYRHNERLIHPLLVLWSKCENHASIRIVLEALIELTQLVQIQRERTTFARRYHDIR